MSEARPALLDAARVRTLVTDGALGTRLIALGLDLKTDDPALWNLSRPDDVQAIHALDLAAGADAVLTNTFGANRVWLDRFHRGGDAPALNRRAVALARAAEGPDRYVIGSIGPTATADRDLDAVLEQADALAESGVDALVFETCRGRQASRMAAVAPGRPPLIASFGALDESLGDEVRRLEDLGVAAVGINCTFGLASALEQMQELRRLTALPLWIKPAAALPGAPAVTPEAFAAAVPQWRALGARFVGGCCGSTEAHVAALRAACYTFST